MIISRSIFGVFVAFAFLCISQSNVASENTRKNRTTITDLPLELLLMIYENFNLADLSAVARSHPINRHVAEIKFHDLVGDGRFTISEDGLEVKKNASSTVNIGDMDAMYSALKSFGHLFTHLTLHYSSFSAWEAGKINARLSEHLGDSLVEITLKNFAEKHFKHLIGPFNKVEVIHFSGCYFTSEITNLPAIFPVVRKFQSEEDQDIAHVRGFFKHHFPHLQEVKYSNRDSTTNRLQELLELNPQITELSLQIVYWEFLEKIDNILPQLEHLEIKTLFVPPFHVENLHFAHLKSFKLWFLRDNKEGDDLAIDFSDNLEEIVDWTSENVLINFILRSKHLKKVGIDGRSYIFGNEHFKRIAEELPNLETFMTAMYVTSEQQVDKVVWFLETAKNLKVLKLRSCFDDAQRLINEATHSEWEMIKGRLEEEFHFVRR